MDIGTIKQESTTVSSITQARFYLDQGKILFTPISRFTFIFVEKESDGRYILTEVPKRGSSVLYEGDEESLEELVGYYDLYYSDKLSLIERNPTIVDKAIGLLLGIGRRLRRYDRSSETK